MAIRVNPDDLDKMAANLDQQGQLAMSLATAISNAIQMGTAAWEGASQADFVAKYEQIKPTLTRDLPELIAAMAKAARKRANDFRAADSV